MAGAKPETQNSKPETSIIDFSLRLDLIKIVAMFWIVAYHFYAAIVDFAYGVWQMRPIFPNPADFMTGWPLAGTVYGYAGITSFFIISGIGLTYSQAKKERGWKEFFVTRVLRIYPLYWAVLLLTLLTLWHYEPGRYFDPVSILLHFLGVHTLFGSYMQDLNGPLWFIGAVIQLYLFFPLLYWVLKKSNGGVLLALAVLLKGIELMTLNQIPGIGTVAVTYLPEFALGMYLGWLWARNPSFRIHWRIGLGMSVATLFLLFSLSSNRYYVEHGLGIINFDALLGIGSFFTLDFLFFLFFGLFQKLKLTMDEGLKELITAGAKGTFVVFMVHILFLNYYFLKQFLWIKPALAQSFNLSMVVIFSVFLGMLVLGYWVQQGYDRALARMERVGDK